MAHKKILILADDRVGTYSQAEALAMASGYQYQIFFLQYNLLKYLPNFIFSSSLIRLKKSIKHDLLTHLEPFDYIISAGRRPATIGLFLKKYFNKKFKFKSQIIQILRPELPLNKFDFVILPNHDKILFKSSKNIIFSFGSLVKSNFNEKNLDKISDLKIEKTNFFAVLIGGDTKKNKFNLKNVKKLINISLNIKNITKNSLILLNSRRTSQEINNYLDNLRKKDIIFYDYNKLKDNNPYQEILQLAKFIIITGDSVSMISDCCQFGKAVFIFDDEKICSKKHQKFHQELYKKNYAISVDNFDIKLLEKNYKILDEAKRISAQIF